jgi:hypothetical protein
MVGTNVCSQDVFESSGILLEKIECGDTPVFNIGRHGLQIIQLLQLTPWSKVLEKLIDAQLVKKLPVFYRGCTI